MTGFFKKAVILYGQPGAGKGTIANLLAESFGFIHFDTGEQLRKIISTGKGKIIERERKLMREGKLCTPSWILNIVKRETEKIAKAGLGIIFSGSPRTIYEAFGSKKGNGLMACLESLYGKKNIYIFKLKVSEKTSISRNSHRLVCSVCGKPILSFLSSHKISRCPYCGGKLIKRKDDSSVSLIKKRIKEYENRTEPVFKILTENNFSITEVNGEGYPYEVLERIKKILTFKN